MISNKNIATGETSQAITPFHFLNVSLLRERFDGDQATTSGKSSQPDLALAKQKFSEFRMRWVTWLEKCTDDWALKTKLLESLEDAYLAPVSVLSDGDFSKVKDKFFEGDLSPVRFLEEMQTLLISKT